MPGHLLVGPISISSSSSASAPPRRHWWTPPIVASSSPWSMRKQSHYAVLGLNLSATSADIKRAYRLLARKYHPDVSKDSQASELFKSIRHAYEVLSNEATRIQYDRALKFREDTGWQQRRQRNYSSEFDGGARIYRWDELRRRMQRERYWEDSSVQEESSSSTGSNGVSEGNSIHERGSFSEVLRSAFISLFLLHTFGSRVSLTLSSLMALLDRKLDAGYKIGYVIAWILGGRGGILLTLSLSFASWACGKTSSSVVALVVVAMWVGSNLARYAPLPQGALLTLLYMSIKLQVDLS
ncbi:Terminal organelle assembly protein [Parasponia andersonii]|uniref:Terminal organelle assembly protein n=1 Tax=Parasponia andersonii TaxID=3476 RepID=A0A2P5AM04_PARAD|nr:Terminal organelle assembly protein [Parasponia andersonii]